jgi:hypothetical protein
MYPEIPHLSQNTLLTTTESRYAAKQQPDEDVSNGFGTTVCEIGGIGSGERGINLVIYFSCV